MIEINIIIVEKSHFRGDYIQYDYRRGKISTKEYTDHLALKIRIYHKAEESKFRNKVNLFSTILHKHSRHTKLSTKVVERKIFYKNWHQK